MDLESQALLAEVLSQYRGSLIVVTHSEPLAQTIKLAIKNATIAALAGKRLKKRPLQEVSISFKACEWLPVFSAVLR